MNSGTEKEGGQQVGIGPVAAAKCGPAAGLLVFLVGAALLALVGLVAEAGVIEAQIVAAATSGRPRGGQAAAAGFVAVGCLAAERGGRAAGTPAGLLWGLCRCSTTGKPTRLFRTKCASLDSV